MPENTSMQLVAEMRAAIELLGGDAPRKRALESAARRAGITIRQAKSLFYGEGNPRAEVVDRVRAAVRDRQSERLREARDAYQELVASITRAEVALRIRDEDFHCFDIDALREMVSGADRTVAEKEGE